MACENMRYLLDEINTNIYEAMSEVKDLTSIEAMLKNEHLFDGYKLMVEEDKLYVQERKDIHSLEINKEIKEHELEVRMQELEQKREQFILENELKKDELKLKEKIHEDEMKQKDRDHARELQNIDIRREENKIRAEELKHQKRRTIVDYTLKGTVGLLTGGITLIALGVGNEGILNDTARKLVGTLISNWPCKLRD